MVRLTKTVKLFMGTSKNNVVFRDALIAKRLHFKIIFYRFKLLRQGTVS